MHQRGTSDVKDGLCWKCSCRKLLKTNSEWPQSGPYAYVTGREEVSWQFLQEASRVEPRILRPMHYESSAWDFLLNKGQFAERAVRCLETDG